jgi:fucose 4-O-acetylase-like acetyltransferase
LRNPVARPELTLLGPLRLLASFSVVAHHMRGGDLFGVRFGLFTFIVLALALHVGRVRDADLSRTAAHKFRGLLAPWLRWSAVYVALAITVGTLREGDPLGRLEPWMLATGGHASLWFLPFIFVSTLAVSAGVPALERRSPVLVALAAALLGGLASHAASAALAAGVLSLPVDAWVRAAPLVPFGVALGFAARCAGPRRNALLAALVAIAIANWLGAPAPFHEDLGRRIAVAVGLVAVAIAFAPRLPAVVDRVARLSFGVYLAHPLVAKLLAEVADPFAWSTAAHAAVVWALSAALIAFLARIGVPGAEFAPRSGAPSGLRQVGPSASNLKAPAA